MHPSIKEVKKVNNSTGLRTSKAQTTKGLLCSILRVPKPNNPLFKSHYNIHLLDKIPIKTIATLYTYTTHISLVHYTDLDLRIPLQVSPTFHHCSESDTYIHLQPSSILRRPHPPFKRLS